METSLGFNAPSPPPPPAFTTNSQEPNFSDAYLQPLSTDHTCFFNFFTQDFPSFPLQTQLPDIDYSLFFSSSLPPSIPDDHHFFSKSLPDLQSLEQPHCQPRLPVSSSLKRPRLDLILSDSDNNPQTLDSIVQSFTPPAPIIPHSEIARRRRQKISEKTRCLQKLMPWDKKMDTGTMLQEAYKYIQFLQAQISILQSMPITSCFVSAERVDDPFGFDYTGLGRLNRQQLLQVLLNSPAAQTMLYSQGFCVISDEQLLLLKKAKEWKTADEKFLTLVRRKKSISGTNLGDIYSAKLRFMIALAPDVSVGLFRFPSVLV
ncbi:hypothetical protein PTKIN_Ptkin10aG0080600 [Pterospermum kingtungense]